MIVLASSLSPSSLISHPPTAPAEPPTITALVPALLCSTQSAVTNRILQFRELVVAPLACLKTDDLHPYSSYLASHNTSSTIVFGAVNWSTTKQKVRSRFKLQTVKLWRRRAVKSLEQPTTLPNLLTLTAARKVVVPNCGIFNLYALCVHAVPT
ncbi:hypothetical protein C8R45DRAFT_1102948 [Mycena sanguinolenta]|nr:hypothetical protein C8R45DRAFT_1102948 [Mycena sanguinolenta]